MALSLSSTSYSVTTRTTWGHALHEATCELLSVQILTDEDHLAALLLVRSPCAFHRVCKEHVDCLEDKLLLHAFDSKNTLASEEVGAPLFQKP